jgi:hypothetical protein
MPPFHSADVAAAAPVRAHRRHRTSGWFFVGISAILFVTVLAGFAPTFYLRGYVGTARLALGPPTLPVYLQVHGVLLTAWFLMFLIQTAFVAAHRTDLHRRMGVASAILAAAVVIVTLLVLIRAVPRFLSNGLPEALMPRFALFIIGDMGSLVVFSVLVATAVYFRRQPEVHKRLMLLGNISIIGPAVSRLPGVSAFPVLVLFVQLAFLIALIVHDLVKNRRVYRATLWGELGYILVTLLSSTLALSHFGRAIIRALA